MPPAMLSSSDPSPGTMESNGRSDSSTSAGPPMNMPSIMLANGPAPASPNSATRELINSGMAPDPDILCRAYILVCCISDCVPRSISCLLRPVASDRELRFLMRSPDRSIICALVLPSSSPPSRMMSSVVPNASCSSSCVMMRSAPRLVCVEIWRCRSPMRRVPSCDVTEPNLVMMPTSWFMVRPVSLAYLATSIMPTPVSPVAE